MEMDFATRLRVQYGLPPEEPTAQQLECFLATFDRLQEAGVAADEAGVQAARKCFPGYGTWKYGAISTQSISTTVAQIKATLRAKRGK